MSTTSHRDETRRGLPEGYELEEVGNNLLLKRPNGFLIAAFGQGTQLDKIRRVADMDVRYLKAVEREKKFGPSGDSETAVLFAMDVREARTEFLLALEAAYQD